MFNLVFTIVYDIISSIRLTSLLEFGGLIIVCMLFCSPTSVATILGASTKLGIFSHLRDRKKTAKAEA